MGISVICISQTDGSGGEGIGRMVADQLGLRYVDDDLIVEASRLAQVDPALVAASEHKQSLMQRLLEGLVSAQSMLGSATLAAGILTPTMHAPSARRASKDDLRSMIRAAVLEVGKRGNAVIAAHAASFALAGKPGVLRVLITAPTSVRCGCIARDHSLTAEAAATAVTSGDEGRKEYLRSVYEIEEELPTHYDLVINTGSLTAAQAAGLIVSAARS